MPVRSALCSFQTYARPGSTVWTDSSSTRKLLGTWQTAASLSLMWPVDDIFVPPVVITLLCRDTVSARTVVGHSLLLARLPGTHWVTICVIQRLALTVSDVHSRLVWFQSTSTSSALEVLHSMRYINLRLTYLLTECDLSLCRRLSTFKEEIVTSTIFSCFKVEIQAA